MSKAPGAPEGSFAWQRQPVRTSIAACLSLKQEDGTSLGSQEEYCRDFAAKHGLAVVAVAHEVWSGGDRHRPGLDALIDDLQAGDTLVAYALDRFSRDQIDTAILIDRIEAAGASLKLVTEDFEKSATGTFLRSARAFAAELELEKIRERTSRGKRSRVKAGKPAVGPRPALGYRWRDDCNDKGKPVKLRLIEDPATSWIVRRIFDELVSGVSTRQVAKRLSDDSIKTPTGRSQWAACTINLIAKNPVYCGQARAFRYQRERVKGHKVLRGGQWVDGKGWRYTRRDDAETIALPDAAPALVLSRASSRPCKHDWRATSARASATTSTPKRRCCATAMRSAAIAGIICSPSRHGAAAPSTGAARRTATHTTAPASRCRRTCWTRRSGRVSATGCSIANLIAAELERLRQAEPTGGDVSRLDQQLATLARKQRNLMNRLADEDDADIATLIRADLQRLRDDQKTLDAERSAVEQQRVNWQQTQQRLSELDAWISRVATNLDDLDYAGRRLAMEACRVRVEVFASDHSPRWQAFMQLGGSAPLLFADTTGYRSTGWPRDHRGAWPSQGSRPRSRS